MAYRDESSDPYVYEGTDILKNLGNIRDGAALQAFETVSTIARQTELEKRPVAGSFDLAHLKAVHHYLFQDVYPWAGKTRKVDIAKGISRFCSHLQIESYAQSVFAQLTQEREAWRKAPASVDIPERLAYYLGEINALHPFREGNGRTQRIFISQLAAEHDIQILWGNMNQGSMILASIESFHVSHHSMADLIRANMEERPISAAIRSTHSKQQPQKP